ncbi:resolvase [Streptomyces sp. NPDC093089]|uniref:resolvase n=1 Tax=Streptomyces sp. NPDC093089 TaxID=3366024 RepID=UPI00380F72AF
MSANEGAPGVQGHKGRRRPAVPADKTDDVRTAYLEGRSIAALAREHYVSRGAIRTAVADLLPGHAADAVPAPELPITLDMPGKIADFLRTADLEPAERATFDHGQAVRRGTGYTLRVTVAPALHRQLLDHCKSLDGTGAIPAQRKARRMYANRVSDLDQ